MSRIHLMHPAHGMPSDRQMLKHAVRQLVAAAGGGERAAQASRVSQQQISNYGNVNMAESFAPVDVIADLEAVTQGAPGAPHVTRVLALLAGFALVPVASPPAGAARAGEADEGADEGAAMSAADWYAQICDLAAHAGGLAAAISKGLKDDGVICPRDVREGDLIGQARELLDTTAALVDALQGALDTG